MYPTFLHMDDSFEQVFWWGLIVYLVRICGMLAVRGPCTLTHVDHARYRKRYPQVSYMLSLGSRAASCLFVPIHQLVCVVLRPAAADGNPASANLARVPFAFTVEIGNSLSLLIIEAKAAGMPHDTFNSVCRREASSPWHEADE